LFKVAVREDKTAAIAVYKGVAKIDAGGRMLSIKANQYVLIDTSGVATAVMTLPDPPQVEEPSERMRRVYRDFPPSISFRWRAARDPEGYRVLIARDPKLMETIVDEVVERTSFKTGGLVAGKYYWGVTAMTRGVDGAPSTARTLEMVEDRVPPALEVVFGEPSTRLDSVALSGKAEPGARVFVGGVPAEMDDDGAFHATAVLTLGANLVVVEAVDAAGNTAYRSQEIRRIGGGGQP
jgi:hypothetical protein